MIEDQTEDSWTFQYSRREVLSTWDGAALEGYIGAE